MNSEQFSTRFPDLASEKLKMEALCFFSNESKAFGKIYLTERRIVLYRFNGTHQKILLNEIQDVTNSWGIDLKLPDSKVCKIFSLKPSLFKEILQTRNELKSSSWWGMFS